MPKLNNMFPSKYLKAADFGDDDEVLTIVRLEEDVVGQGRDAKEVWVLFFRELDKGLILNKTNTNSIARLYGDDTDLWIGKRVTLFATDVQFQTEMVPAIRIRPRRPNGKGPPAARLKSAPVPVDDDGDDDDDVHDRDDVPF